MNRCKHTRQKGQHFELNTANPRKCFKDKESKLLARATLKQKFLIWEKVAMWKFEQRNKQVWSTLDPWYYLCNYWCGKKRWTSTHWITLYSWDQNNKHLNNKLLLVWYSDVWHSNGGLVFRIPDFWIPDNSLQHSIPWSFYLVLVV